MSYLNNLTFSTIVKNTPLISIDLIIYNDRQEVLLGKRLNAPAKGFWFTPGGRIYKNETLIQAFERITATELGIPTPLSEATFHGVYEHLYTDSVFGKHISTHYVVLAYNLSLISNDKIIDINNQHLSYRWQAIEKLSLDTSVHTYVKRYFQNHA